MRKSIWILAVSSLVVCTVKSDEDRSHWVDPLDPFQDEENIKDSKINECNCPEREEKMKNQPTCEESSDLKPCLKKKLELEKKLKDLESLLDEKPASETPYFQQFVNHVLTAFKLPEDWPDVCYNADIKLSTDDINTLRRYLDGQSMGPQDAHHVIVSMFDDVNMCEVSQKMLWSSWIVDVLVKDYLVPGSQIMIGVGMLYHIITAQVRRGVSLRKLFFNVLLLLFFVSIPWNWWHMYQTRLSEKYAQSSDKPPDECFPEKQTLFSTLRGMFTLDDRCAKYYKAVNIDPLWEIPPTSALSVTIVKFFVEPLEHIGEALGKFVRATFGDLPVTMWPVVFAILLPILLLILVMAFGYKINVLGWLFGIEPHHGPGMDNGALRDQVEDLREQLEDYRNTIRELKEERQELKLEKEGMREQIAATTIYPSIQGPTASFSAPTLPCRNNSEPVLTERNTLPDFIKPEVYETSKFSELQKTIVTPLQKAESLASRQTNIPDADEIGGSTIAENQPLGSETAVHDISGDSVSSAVNDFSDIKLTPTESLEPALGEQKETESCVTPESDSDDSIEILEYIPPPLDQDNDGNTDK